MEVLFQQLLFLDIPKFFFKIQQFRSIMEFVVEFFLIHLGVINLAASVQGDGDWFEAKMLPTISRHHLMMLQS